MLTFSKFGVPTKASARVANSKIEALEPQLIIGAVPDGEKKKSVFSLNKAAAAALGLKQDGKDVVVFNFEHKPHVYLVNVTGTPFESVGFVVNGANNFFDKKSRTYLVDYCGDGETVCSTTVVQAEYPTVEITFGSANFAVIPDVEEVFEAFEDESFNMAQAAQAEAEQGINEASVHVRPEGEEEVW